MARFMLSTLQALLAGDISANDASYTISAHLSTVKRPDGCASPVDNDVQCHVKILVQSVAAGELTVEDAAERLLALSEHFSKGLPLEDFQRCSTQLYEIQTSGIPTDS